MQAAHPVVCAMLGCQTNGTHGYKLMQALAGSNSIPKRRCYCQAQVSKGVQPKLLPDDGVATAWRKPMSCIVCFRRTAASLLSPRLAATACW